MVNFQDLDNAMQTLVKEFSDKYLFSYIGFIGSLDVTHDFDLLILPHENTKDGLFLIKIVQFLDLLKKELSKKKLGLVSFNYQRNESEVKYISKYNSDRDFLIHIVTHIDWEFPDEKVKAIFKEAISKGRTYFGSFSEVNKIKTFKSNPVYIYLFGDMCFNSRYPIELENEKINEGIRYISKHYSVKFNYKNKSNRDKFFELCNWADKLQHQ